MNARGPVFKYGDNIDTDVIIPARYLNTQSAAELASHCMEDIDKSFVARVKAGDIMVGGENFGCGSSREHAPVAIKASGISCVIAKSFARIFLSRESKNSFTGQSPFSFMKKSTSYSRIFISSHRSFLSIFYRIKPIMSRSVLP